MRFPICERCEWKGNVSYCHWCFTSQKNGIQFPGFKPLKNKDQQRLEKFLEVKT